MEQNNFWLNLIAALEKTKSRKQVQSDIKSLGNFYIKLIAKLDNKNTQRQLKGLNIAPTVDLKGVQNATRQAVNTAQKVANGNKVKISYSFDMDRQKLQNQLVNFAKANSRLFSNKEMTLKYNQLVDSASIVKSKTEINSLRKQLSAFRTELVACSMAGMTWNDRFKASISHFAQYFSGASFVYGMIYQLRNAWTEAKTLDDSLVNLQKVTSEIENRDSLYKYFDRAMSKANELNVKVGSLIDAVTEFKKLGWSLSDAELGGQWASILENVGDVDIETAIGSIKTAVASFDKIGGYGNDQMDKKLEAYVDLINNMSNKYSIDAQGLSEAIRLSAGTLTEAHTSIEQAAVMFSKANEFYNDPSYLGNTAKIGSLRVRATTGDKEAINDLAEMGEDVENVTALTGKLREELLSLTGVDIMESNNTFKSYYQQLYEIAQVIDDLDDVSSAKVLEDLFGKSRAAAGKSLLSGLQQDGDKAYKDAMNSSGSAMQEYETWMLSADASIQRFSNSLTEMYQSIINGNTVRDLADMGSAVLNFANNWGIVEGAIKGFLALKIGTFITNGTMAFLSATKQVERYGRALKMAGSVPDGNLSQKFTTLKAIAQTTSSLTTAQKKQVLSNKALSQQDRIRILQLQGLSKEMALQKLAEMKLTSATNAQTAANTAQMASTFSLKSAIRGLGSTIKGAIVNNPFGVALTAITIGVSAFTSAISNYNQKLEEARKKSLELANSYKEQQSSLDSQIEKYKELQEKLNDSNISEDETRSIKEQLLEIQQSLVESYGNEASNLDLVNGKYKEQLGLLGELSKEKASEFARKNEADYSKAKTELEKEREYNVGNVVFTNKTPDLEGMQKLLEYLSGYENLDLTYSGGNYGQNYSQTVRLSVNADVADAEKIMEQLYDDLKEYGEKNDIDVSGLTKGISEQLKGAWTEELTEYKTIYDEFMKAEIVRNDTLRPLYQQSIQAVEDYNNALSTGEGIEEAKTNLDTVKKSVKESTGELEGSQDVFDSIFDGINKDAQATYDLNQAFENNKVVKHYADLLKGLSDIDLEAINFDNDNLEKGEEVFTGLLKILGLSQDEAQKLIDKLVELGYIKGNIQNLSSVEDTTALSLSDWLKTNIPGDDSKTYSDTIDDYESKISSLTEYCTKLKEAATMDDMDSSDLTQLAQDFGITGNSIEELNRKIQDTINLEYDSMIEAIDTILKDQKEDSPTYKAFKALEEQIKRTRDEAIKTANDSSNSLKGLSTMKGGMSSIISAYQEKKDSDYNTVSASTLNGIYDTLGVSEWDKANQEAWDNYYNCAANGKTTLKELKNAQDELATAYVNSNSFLEELTESNKEAYVTMLKEMGVKNANKVVTDILAEEEKKLEAQKYYTENASRKLKDATTEEYLEFYKEADATEISKVALAQLQLAKIDVNNVKIDTSSDIENIIGLANAAGSSATVLQKLANAKAIYKKAEDGLLNGSAGDLRQLEAADQLMKDIEDGNFDFEFLKAEDYKVDIVKTDPTVNSNDSKSKDSKSSSKKDTKEDFDWIERRINKLKKAFEKWNKQAEESMNPKRISAYYKLAGNELKKLLSTEQSAYAYYRKKAQSVGLDESYASKVRNGTIEIDTIKNEKLIEKIKDYQTWYDKMTEMSDSFLEDVQNIYSIPSQKREQLVERFETSNDILDGREDLAIGYKKKNKILTKKRKNAKGIYDTYVNAQKETESNLNSAKKGVLSNSKLMQTKGVAKAVKSGKEIDLNGLREGTKEYEDALKYNEALRKNKEAIQDRTNALNEYKQTVRELKAEKFENISKQFEDQIGLIDNKFDDLSNKISDIESAGKVAGAKLYKKQIGVHQDILQQLELEEAALKKRIKYTEKGTDDWYEQKEAIQEVQNQESEQLAKIHEIKQAINEIADTVRNNIIDSFHDIEDEMDLLNTLLGENLTDNETGDFTKEGRASLSLLKDQMEISRQSTEAYLTDINKLERAIENGNWQKFKDSNGQEYDFASIYEANDKLKELQDSYREEVKNSYEYENSIISLVKQRYEAESEYLGKLIDKKKELLETEKDLHDYSNNIKKQTDNINSLQKQISALSGDTSVENNARVQKLQKQLKEAEESLENDEYEKYISDQEKMLDNLTKEHELLVEKHCKDRDALLKEGNRIIEENGAEIKNTLSETAENYNVSLTENTMSIIADMGNIKTILEEIRDYEKERVTVTPSSGDDNSGNGSGTTDDFEKNMKEATASAVTAMLEANTKNTIASSAATMLSTIATPSETAKNIGSNFAEAVFAKTVKDGLKKVSSVLPFSSVTKKLFGFSKGGVLNAKDAIKANGDDFLVSAKEGERILTPVQNEMWEKWTESLPNLLDLSDSLKPHVIEPVNVSRPASMDVNYSGNNIQVTLPDVRNYEDFMKKFQKDPNAEKLVCNMAANAMSNNTSRLNKFNQKF